MTHPEVQQSLGIVMCFLCRLTTIEPGFRISGHGNGVFLFNLKMIHAHAPHATFGKVYEEPRCIRWSRLGYLILKMFWDDVENYGVYRPINNIPYMIQVV